MDKYSLRARVYPMLILFLPLVVIGLAYSFEYEKYQQSLSALGITAALTYFLSNLGRDQGKKKEPDLWASWGGPPTSQVLSYKNDRVDVVTKGRYHSKMKEISKLKDDIDFVNTPFEDLCTIYESWVKILISKTRDTKKYPLLFKENISYGFRRNLWGLKPFGIVIVILCALGNYVFQSSLHGYANVTGYPATFYISELILFLIAVFWVCVITDEWVKIPAFAYAERLLEAIDTL